MSNYDGVNRQSSMPIRIRNYKAYEHYVYYLCYMRNHKLMVKQM